MDEQMDSNGSHGPHLQKRVPRIEQHTSDRGLMTQRIPLSSVTLCSPINSGGWTTQRIPTSSADNVCTTISRQPCNLTGRNLTTTRIPISSATCCRPGNSQLLWTTLAHRELHTLGNMVPWLLWNRTTTTNKTAPTNTVNGSRVDCTLYKLWWCGCHAVGIGTMVLCMTLVT